ncbi:MAG: DUF7010 family protein [Chloroflexota bacterium]
MDLHDAQGEIRSAFLGGSVGQLVTGVIWLLSAALSTFVGQGQGIVALFVGGMLIFPLTQLSLRLLGKLGALSRENPLSNYSLQSVFAMGAMYPLIYAATLHNVNWFYPAFMMVVAAHYVSFILLYGMPQYGVLAAALFASGLALALLAPNAFSLGGWVAGLLLLAFAGVVWKTAAWRRPQAASASA